MKELLTEIDELLAHLEDFTHGQHGEDITQMRYKIQYALNGLIEKSNSCDHDYKIEVPAIDGNMLRCTKCDATKFSDY